MNEKISAWHAKARAIEQERLFKQAAAALPPDMSGKPSTGSTNPGSSQSSPHGLHKSLSRNDPIIQTSFRHLELSANASHEDVRRKFKELALRFHPDRSSHHDSTVVFQMI